MTERKTTGKLTIFKKLDAGKVPAPWVPPELPAMNAPGRAVAIRDRSTTTPPPAPWVPPELPVPAAGELRAVAKAKPWVPPAEVPRHLPAVSDDEDEVEILPPKKRKRGRDQTVEPAQNTAGQPIIIHNIINQSAPAPVVYAPWWGPSWWWRFWWW